MVGRFEIDSFQVSVKHGLGSDNEAPGSMKVVEGLH